MKGDLPIAAGISLFLWLKLASWSVYVQEHIGIKHSAHHCFSILVLFGELENSPEKFTSFSLSLSLSHTIYDNLAMSMKHKKKKVKILIAWSRRECPSSLWLIARIHTSLVGRVKWLLILWCRRSAALELERLGFKFQLCRFLAMWTQTSYLTAFGLSFLICKIDFIELWKFRKIIYLKHLAQHLIQMRHSDNRRYSTKLQCTISGEQRSLI